MFTHPTSVYSIVKLDDDNFLLLGGMNSAPGSNTPNFLKSVTKITINIRSYFLVQAPPTFYPRSSISLSTPNFNRFFHNFPSHLRSFHGYKRNKNDQTGFGVAGEDWSTKDDQFRNH
jgi:hypothetical protein